MDIVIVNIASNPPVPYVFNFIDYIILFSNKFLFENGVVATLALGL
jgi:hypothetical protein